MPARAWAKLMKFVASALAHTCINQDILGGRGEGSQNVSCRYMQNNKKKKIFYFKKLIMKLHQILFFHHSRKTIQTFM